MLHGSESNTSQANRSGPAANASAITQAARHVFLVVGGVDVVTAALGAVVELLAVVEAALGVRVGVVSFGATGGAEQASTQQQRV